MRSHKMIISFFTAFLLLATSGTFSLCVGEELIRGKPTFPGKACQTKPLPDWMPQEKWVWKRVCEGKIADLSKFEGFNTKAALGKFGYLSEIRILTPEFLETILLHEPFRGALTRHGVKIVGAWFKDKIDLSNSTLAHPLWLEGSRFDKDVYLNHLKTPCVISLKGSKFNGELIMDSLQVDNYLLMRDNAEFNYVSLLNAKIGSALEMDGSKFRDKLVMQRLEVENNLYMRYGAEFEDVVLSRAKIKGNLELSGSTFRTFDMTGTGIVREFRLSSKNEGTITDAGAAKWREGSKLTLLNTKVGVLQDSISSWPKYLKVELEGFTYERLGNFIKDDGNGIEIRDVSWLKKWMWKQEKYSPQPYEHLAKLLRQDGRKEEARKILFAGKSREHREATNIWCWFFLAFLLIVICSGYYIRVLGFVMISILVIPKFWYWLWLMALWIFIGYGYCIHYALFWALGLVVLGTIVLRVSRQYCKKDRNHKDLKYWGLAYSIDMLLPIIHLRKYHYDKIELEGGVRVYFYVHKILGYALALFIITGLTGIVK